MTNINNSKYLCFIDNSEVPEFINISKHNNTIGRQYKIRKNNTCPNLKPYNNI